VQAIEHRYPDRLQEYVEQLANHAFKGEVWDKALTYLRRAGTKAAARSAHLDHPYSLAAMCSVLAYLHIARGELGHAVRLLERGVALSHEWNLAFHSAQNTGILGYAYALSGRIAEGIPLLEHALSAIETMGFGAFQPPFLVYLGEAYVLADRLEQGLEFAGRALTLTRERGQRGYDLGGDSAISAAQRTLVDVAIRTRLYLDHVDAFLMEQPTLVVRRKRNRHHLMPLVEQRLRLADSLARVLGQLGLERRQKPPIDLTQYLSQRRSPSSPDARPHRRPPPAKPGSWSAAEAASRGSRP
jgi:tetratricopeptide (TPR) repeat protein